jgi:TrkA domain protein
MNIDITNRVLPGIGVCQEIDLRDGHRIGVVSRRNGLRDLIFYDEEGEGAAAAVSLSEDEANAVAEVLGAPALTFRLAVLQRHAEGLIVEQLPVPADSPLCSPSAWGYAGSHAHWRVHRGGVAGSAAVTSPTPDFVLLPGDLVVTVGTQAAIDQVAQIA